uniref:Eukaryotic translation initiation factor 3 subunit L n=1 Tax=Proboscia inermis TaxID=420281 RepID=A0A7S0GKJ9_9STRA|mmetsp:Transcript_51990/g.52379  ORF Transcript_51990/g.52379 Transcript_51990/m.52379 type:complete len:532 (+) Transcript_51990:105-1700(+)|eukprot:CAMPEP_0194354690 /NCGR_PEP_ID=MMETSP0174-20130528/2761_1 /TAXON_ID=216777 /ORGANISM="Proboscia alata, Strain PI-D3" /LENGTH=531 /DNA_ID=CAMNT_0039123701 /DNA_START=127 /DNA_END=1725 /DNA_ORIENTATION=+
MSEIDACLPAPLKDFVFDLHDSARRSFVVTEQEALYTGEFRELTSKYFSNTAWPSTDSVSSECGADPLFLALYKELTHRHLHSISRPQVRDRIDGWRVYRALFDQLLKEADAASEEGAEVQELYILPTWAFDIMHEFVYQFQGFCQFRTTSASNASQAAKKEDDGNNGQNKSHHLNETMDVLTSNRDAWAVETVLFYLHRLVVFAGGNAPTKAHYHLGVFARVALSRMECLLGDYRACLSAVSPIVEERAVVDTVFSARLSLAYHAGVSYLMLRRYRDAARTLGSICSALQRAFKTGQIGGRNNNQTHGGNANVHNDQSRKINDRMIALLAIVTHVCPATWITIDDERVSKLIREKHGSQLAKIEAGEEGYEDLFMFACPKFVSPAVPDYGGVTKSHAANHDVYRLQVRQFMLEMNQHATLRKLRSYMKLYSSIGVEKLAAFNDVPKEEFVDMLLCYKHRMRQLEVVPGESEGEAAGEEAKDALDIHFFLDADVVHVDEAAKQRRFEKFFLTQISLSGEISREAELIKATI